FVAGENLELIPWQHQRHRGNPIVVGVLEKERAPLNPLPNAIQSAGLVTEHVQALTGLVFDRGQGPGFSLWTFLEDVPFDVVFLDIPRRDEITPVSLADFLIG